ncbi:hypothetical protein GCM10023187_14830 [Nibrella viscosa]|uniref:Lipocalin-like domain-containing protein n=1 Tax=Nibrella viscosa TaxID=1084524 RepID=A0ABP8K713_9BACT
MQKLTLCGYLLLVAFCLIACRRDVPEPDNLVSLLTGQWWCAHTDKFFFAKDGRVELKTPDLNASGSWSVVPVPDSVTDLNRTTQPLLLVDYYTSSRPLRIRHFRLQLLRRVEDTFYAIRSDADFADMHLKFQRCSL